MTRALGGTPALRATSRGNVCFSPLGRYAACVARTGCGETFLEQWTLDCWAPSWCRLATRRPLPPRCRLAPCDDGRILVLRPMAGRDEISLITPLPSGDATEKLIGSIKGFGARLIPAPFPSTLAYVAVPEPNGETRLLRIDSMQPGLVAAGTVPGHLASAVWLHEHRHRLGFTHLHDGLVRPAAVTLGENRPHRPDPLPGDAGSPTRLLAASPRSGLLLLACGKAGNARLGWSTVDSASPVRFADEIDRTEGVVLPLGVSPQGEEIALGVTAGASSRIALWQPATGRLREIHTGTPGSVTGVGQWNRTALRFPYSAPAFPAGMASVEIASGRVRLDPRPRESAWARARTEVFDGPAGPIEAVVYGDWRTAANVVMALHGGPETAWRLEFEPVFQHLAAAGMAIVAPNQRGSTGYGAGHGEATRGAWAGPDLEDIVHLAEAVAGLRGRGRPGLRLYGVGYGAYLALVAAAHRPELWDRCVAVAPFLSGTGLYEHATAAAADGVRRVVDRLGGRVRSAAVVDHRDLEALAPRLTLPVLLVHGARDEVVPAAQSRRLLHLLRNGEPELLEVPGAGHDPFFGAHAAQALSRVSDFLLAVRAGVLTASVSTKEQR